MKERPILFSAPMVRAILSGSKTQTRRTMKRQPYISPTNPPKFSDTAVGDLFVCPDCFPTTDTPGLVIAECESVGIYHCMGQREFSAKHSPYGCPGDRLWVRETCHAYELPSGLDGVRYLADDSFTPIENSEEAADRWGELACYGMKKSGRAECRKVPSIHMPRWASRILLEITAVRVERLNEISEADAMAEGITTIWPDGPRCDKGPNHYTIPIGNISYNAPTAAGVYSMLWEQINGDGSWAANPWVWVVEFRRVAP